VLASTSAYPTATIVEALEGLHAYGVVERYVHQRNDDDTWSLSKWARTRLDSIGLTPQQDPTPAPDGPADEAPDALDDTHDPLSWADRQAGIGPYAKKSGQSRPGPGKDK
jgi:hypothetical protein